MVDPAFIKMFYDYIKWDTAKGGFGNPETELVNDAPQSAIDAFEEFKRMEENAKQQGIEL
jgi:hypothetical protein